MLTLAVAAGCALLGVIAVGGDTSSLSHTVAFPARPLTGTTHGTSRTTPARPARPQPRPPPGHRPPRRPRTASCQHSYGLACYSPGQIQRAYDLPSLYARGLDGRGRTIVIVDSFGSPTIRHDLRVFDSAFGLPGPPSLRVLQPEGRCRATTRTARTWWMRPVRPPPTWRPHTRWPREPASSWPRRRRPRP